LGNIRVARLVKFDAPLEVGTAPKPMPGPRDVLVRVKYCGLVPNTMNIIRGHPYLITQSLPAIFGMDVSGEIEAVGEHVLGLAAGDRVYVDPYLSCETCEHCRSGHRNLCEYAVLRGYMGWSKYGRFLMDRYPYGGLSEYVVAPDVTVLKLPEPVSLETAARFGYLCTSFGALGYGGFRPGHAVLINGITGTLGVAAAIMAIGMGATKVMGTGRNKAVIEKLKAIAPGRIFIHSPDEGDAADWAMRLTDGAGADLLYDCLGYGGDANSTNALLRAVKGGRTVVLVAGGVPGEVSQKYYEILNRDVHLRGSTWFKPEDLDRMAKLMGSGVIDMSCLEHRIFQLEQVNDALALVDGRPGGFTNVLVSLH